MSHCCEGMRKDLERICPDHPDRYDCPDALIAYFPASKEYGLIVHDGGTSHIAIRFCPWCGCDLSQR